jgi:hypothetical protein
VSEQPPQPAFKRPWVIVLLFAFIGLTWAIYLFL